MPKRLSKQTRVFRTGGRGITTRGRKVGRGIRASSPTRLGRKAGRVRGRKR